MLPSQMLNPATVASRPVCASSLPHTVTLIMEATARAAEVSLSERDSIPSDVITADKRTKAILQLQLRGDNPSWCHIGSGEQRLS